MKTVDVIIVGAGSTGLFLAAKLKMAGLSYLVLEKRVRRSGQSRAIGIHPPGLNQLNTLGLLDRFTSSGVTITRGEAWVNGKKVGSMTLGTGTGHDFILSVPQANTESMLEEIVGSDMVMRGIAIQKIDQNDEIVYVEYSRSSGASPIEQHCVAGRFLIGCDGSNSFIRKYMGADWVGRTYGYSYTMGDYPDNTPFGRDAAVYLSHEGLTESFPLPGQIRRWVVNHEKGDLNPIEFTDMVKERTGFSIKPSDALMHSNFRISRHRSTKLIEGRIILAGDAAHVMSPIGGQAMSLHWVHCDVLAEKLTDILGDRKENGCTYHESGLIDNPVNNHLAGGKQNITNAPHRADEMIAIREKLQRYESMVFNNARRYAKRSDFNTRMGLPGKNRILLSVMVRICFSPFFKQLLSRRFTMHDLKPSKI